MDTENIISPALMRLRNKPEIPVIDFTMYKQEDGTVVSTRDRVIKGISLQQQNKNLIANETRLNFFFFESRCACTCYQLTY